MTGINFTWWQRLENAEYDNSIKCWNIPSIFIITAKTSGHILYFAKIKFLQIITKDYNICCFSTFVRKSHDTPPYKQNNTSWRYYKTPCTICPSSFGQWSKIINIKKYVKSNAVHKPLNSSFSAEDLLVGNICPLFFT